MVQAAKLAQATSNTVTLRGSTKVVTEFFAFAVNTILFQRGVYPPESFKQQKNYGLSLMVTKDSELSKYLANVLEHMSEWLLVGALQKMVLVIASIHSKEVLERWTFDLQTDKQAVDGGPLPEKSEKQISSEIQAIIRQITASVSFLPLLDEQCSFDLLVYTDSKAEVPVEWEDSDPRFISNAAGVKLRSFTTKIHKVDAHVAYRAESD